jgi:hypothetical protein
MAEALTTEPVPLVFGDDGVMRVRGTRVTPETVLSAFADGATAEEIAQRYPSMYGRANVTSRTQRPETGQPHIWPAPCAPCGSVV